MDQLLVRGGLLIDGSGCPPIEKGSVLMEESRIVAVGPNEKIGPKPNVKVMDCSDQVLIPGLIDCHNHCSLDTTLEQYPSRMNDSDADQTLYSIDNLKMEFKAGVTTTRCLRERIL